LNQASKKSAGQKWVIDFGLLIAEVKEGYGKEVPDLSYARLCDWLRECLIDEFPRYVVTEIVEEERDGESYVIRMIVESPFEPEFRSRYFNLVLVRRYEDVYRSESHR
jgi:hypothetical protein